MFLSCSKCGESFLSKYSTEAETEKVKIANEIKALSKYIPVVTIHHPHQWDYKILGMVTAQSTTGTGAVTEFVTSFTDLVGGQSSRMNNKLKLGENLCFEQIRYNAFSLGGNAVIGTDIDYAEVGGDKGMLMVCMSGTAVFLNNPGILSDETAEKITEFKNKGERLNLLNRLTK